LTSKIVFANANEFCFILCSFQGTIALTRNYKCLIVNFK